MSKISIYEVVPVPKLADKLVGTSVGGEPEDITYNFTLGELLNLFIPNIPGNTLQGVLDFGNTATQNINLTGIITTTTLNVGSTANILNSNLTGETHITGGLYDRLNSIGTAGQVLRSTGTKVEWYSIPNIIPTLQQVLAAGNTADINIILSSNIQALTATANNVVSNTSLSVNGTLKDKDALVGTAGQILSSTGTKVQWIDSSIYTATIPLIINSGTKNISIQQAGSTQGGYLSSADWINFDGKQGAINLTTIGSSGPSTLVGNIINVPNYTLAGLNGVPQTRTLSINGVTYDLSANRAWTIPAGGTVTSVAALTIGTTGTDLSSTVADSTTTPVITLNVPTASATNRGALSAADWTTFNNKQNALTNPITGTGTSGQVAYFNGTNSITSNAAFAFTPTSQLLVNNSVTAATQIARGTNLNSTLIAAANNDVLVGLDINPTFTNGAFTGVRNIGLRVGTFNYDLANQRLGLGTNIPTDNLEVITSITTGIAIHSSGTGANGRTYLNLARVPSIGSTTETGWQFIKDASDNLIFNSLTSGSASNRMTLFTTGNLGINQTTDAGFRLDVNGTARVQSFTTINAAPAVNGESALIVNATTNNSTGGQMYGIRSFATVATNTGNISGIDSTINNSSTATNMAGFNSAVNISANTTAQVKGYSVGGAVTGTGTATSYIGYDYNDVFKAGSGVVTRQFGIRIANLTAGGSTNVGLLFNNAASTTVNGTWDIYAQSGNRSYFEGDISIGTTTLGTATKFTLGGSETASSAIARGQLLNTTLIAAANNDVLVGLDINPTFTNGAFTGVSNYGIRLQGASNDILRINSGTATNSGSGIILAETWGPSTFSGIYLSYFNNSYTTSGFRRANAGILSTTGSGGLNIVSDSSNASIRFYNKSLGGVNQQISEFFATGNLLLQTGGTFTDAGFRLDVNGTFRQTGSTTASSAIAVGSTITPTLVAAANNDVLVGLDINPTFTNGAFTSVRNYAARFNGNISVGTKGQFTTWTNSNFLFIGNASISAANITNSGDLLLTNNSFFNGTNVVYTTTGAVANVNINGSGQVIFQTAPSGTAGATVTATTYGTLFNTGNWLLGTGTTDAGFRLDVNGTSRAQTNMWIGIQNQTTSYTQSNYLFIGNSALSASNGITLGDLAINSNSYFNGTNTIYTKNGFANYIFLNSSGQTQFASAPNGTAGNTATFTQSGLIFNSGNWLLGTGSTDSGFKLDVNGTARVQSDMIVNTFTLGRGLGNNATNTIFGFESLSSNTGTGNTIMGYQSAKANTSGNRNSFFGSQSGLVNTTGSFNSFFGFNAGLANTTGDSNVFIGDSSGKSNITGISNVFIGLNAGQASTTTSSNIAIGRNAAFSNTGGNNTIIGHNAAFSKAGGNNNTILGWEAGRYISDGVTAITVSDNSIFLGYNTKALASSQTNQIVIGYDAVGLGSNTTVLGNSSTTLTALYGSVITGGTSINASAQLQIDSTVRGFLPPRMTTTQKTAISSPATGLIVYQTDGVEGLYIYTSSGWKSLTMV